jgi:hypothetical protein
MIPPLSMTWNLSTIKLPYKVKIKRKADSYLFVDMCQSYQVLSKGILSIFKYSAPQTKNLTPKT